MTHIDQFYLQTQEGRHDAFTSWVSLCEMPLRKSLRSFARVVDVESVLQEGLLRMWRLAPKLKLEGENASLRLALRIVRNLAISEARRLKRVDHLDPETLEQDPAAQVQPDSPPDPALRRAIEFCLKKLPRRPRETMLARLKGLDDRTLAAELDMRVNTFLQNIVRARRLLRKCLEGKGVRLEEFQV